MAKRKARAREQTPSDIVPRALTSPNVAAAVVMASHYTHLSNDEPDVMLLVREIRAQADLVAGGDMVPVEAMLYGQAVALQTIFANLARRASIQTHLDVRDRLLTLALKAQRQSVLSLQALVEAKAPRQATFVRQQNMAGQQVVVNGNPAPALPANEPTGLLEVDRGERLDGCTTGGAARGDPALATVGKLDRAEDRRG